jgi:hypothetical protein
MFGSKQKRERRFQRNQQAWIMLEGGFAKRECQLADISNSGAKIVVSPGELLPRQFTMSTTPNGPAKACKVVWRNGRMAGVKFC